VEQLSRRTELPLVLIVLNTELSEFQTGLSYCTTFGGEQGDLLQCVTKLDSDSDKVSNLYHYMSKVVKRELRSFNTGYLL